MEVHFNICMFLWHDVSYIEVGIHDDLLGSVTRRQRQQRDGSSLFNTNYPGWMRIGFDERWGREGDCKT